MKKFGIIIGFGSLVAFCMLLVACTEDEPVTEENYRDKFLGTWSVEESCVRLDFEVNIEADHASSAKVLIYNFALSGSESQPAYGFVDADTVNLPQQNIGDNWKINGSGIMQTNGSIIWNYYIEIGANGSNCEAEFEK